MSNKLFKKYLKIINETTSYTQVSAKDLGGQRQHEYAPEQSIDKTELSLLGTVKELVEYSSPETYISFINKYDDDIPRLSVNPKVSYNTPHGIYGYPLNSKNITRLVTKKSPTSATFAIERPYIHVYRIITPNLVEIKPAGNGTAITSSYTGINGVREAIVDIQSMTLNLLRRFDSLFENEEFWVDTVGATSDIEFSSEPPELKLKKVSHAVYVPKYIKAYIVNYFYILLSLKSISEKQEAFRKMSNQITKFILTNIEHSNGIKSIKEKKKGFPFFLVYFAAHNISSTLSPIKSYDSNDEDIVIKYLGKLDKGEVFAQLLNDAGIGSISDRGTSTIHTSEPSQAFVTSFVKEEPTYQLLGTYKNPLMFSSEEFDAASTEILHLLHLPTPVLLRDILEKIKKKIYFNIHDLSSVKSYVKKNKKSLKVLRRMQHTFDSKKLISSDLVIGKLPRFYDVLSQNRSYVLIALLFTKSDEVAEYLYSELKEFCKTSKTRMLVLDAVNEYGRIQRESLK